MSTQGFFLGAGASYELGMPLVTELTEILKRDHADDLIRKMQARQTVDIWTIEAAEELIRLLADDELHYEAVIGAIEVEAQRKGQSQNSFETIRQHLVDMVARYLIFQHVSNLTYTLSGLPYLSPISQYIKDNHPLNIFSLNHDVMLEEVCSFLNTPLSAGFFRSNEYLLKSFPNATFGFPFESLTQTQMEQGRFNFFKDGEVGVNLYKLHGGLDTFLFNDCNDFVRFYPPTNKPGNSIQLLGQLQHERHRIEKEDGVRTTGIMTLKDSGGDEHFFDISLVTGAFKFQRGRNSAVGLTIFFERFKSDIYKVQELICVGYGFGDLHVNEVISRWLCSSGENKLVIVDPFLHKLPPFLLHLKRQTEVHKTTFLGFLTSDLVMDKKQDCELFMHQQYREFIKRRNLKRDES